MDCVLCGIVAGTEEASVVREDDRVIAICDLYPMNPGHLLVVTKGHAIGLADLDETDGRQLFTIGQRLAAAVRKTGLRCDGVNLFLRTARPRSKWPVVCGHSCELSRANTITAVPRDRGAGRIATFGDDQTVNGCAA